MPGPPAVPQPRQPTDPSASEPGEKRRYGDREEKGQRKERDINANDSGQCMARTRDTPFHTQFEMKKPCMENWALGFVILKTNKPTAEVRAPYTTSRGAERPNPKLPEYLQCPQSTTPTKG